MSFLLGTWLQALTRKAALGARTRRGASRTRPYRIALRLAALEDRLAPAVITVTSFADSASPGSGSLHAPISAANNGDTIVLPAGTYPITIPGAAEDANLTGDFDISKSITLMGAAGTTPGQVVVDGNGFDRVFDVTGAVNVTLQGLTISSGNVTGDGGSGAAHRRQHHPNRRHGHRQPGHRERRRRLFDRWRLDHHSEWHPGHQQPGRRLRRRRHARRRRRHPHRQQQHHQRQ
jgi:hypothetical protein